MDLVAAARRVIVAMEHATKKGAPKILNHCTLPITGLGVVDTIVTEYGYFKVTGGKLVLEEIAPGTTVEEIQALTEPKIVVSPQLREMQID
jgi:3-oxoacid CoA-transferase subunit B